MTKKIIAILLVICTLLFSLTACGKNKEDISAELFAEISADQTLSSQERWNDAMIYFVENFSHDTWHEKFPELAGPIAYASCDGFEDINIFNLDDKNEYGDTGNGTWSYSDGKFYLPTESWHQVIWSYNLNWTDDKEGSTATVKNERKDGVMLVLLGDYYYYFVLFTKDEPTRLTNLEEHFVDEFLVNFIF